MSVNLDDNLDGTGAGSGTPAGSSAGGDPNNRPSGGAGGGGQPDQTVPIERFQEVTRQVQRFRELGLDALADQFERDPKLRLRVLETVARGDEPVAPATPAAPDPNAQAAGREQFKRLREQDELAATTLVAKTVAEQVVAPLLAPLRQMSVSAVVQNFKARARGALKDFGVVESKFDAIVARRNLSDVDPKMLDAVLGEILAIAYGTATLEVRAKKASQAPAGGGQPNEAPNYGAGGGSGRGFGGGGSGIDPASKEAQAARDMLRYAGFDEKEADAKMTEILGS